MIVHMARREAVCTEGWSAAEEAGGRKNLLREEAAGGEIFALSGFAQTASTCERVSKATTAEAWYMTHLATFPLFVVGQTRQEMSLF
ncbi:MAG: hypothetical protein EOR69_32135 [Mesorhizobium sp.]|nr:MAG: hypothetical protein EOR69_32135 [Mesorhizobium sp.]RWL92867.1 MAG: hypothetical protein EOR70_30220 [Mesorhizobium sp.]